MALQQIEILGYRVFNESANRVARQVCSELHTARPQSFVFLNPHSVVVAEQDPEFKIALMSASGILCDGVGLSLACLVTRRRSVHRIYGYEFFSALSQELSDRGSGRVFFLGGQEDFMQNMIKNYRADYPGIQHVDYYAPPFQSNFSDDDIGDMARRIVAANTEVLWIGLGSPKQEKVLHQLMREHSIPCAAAIGAVFDFYSGRIQHSPRWVRKMGLQWAHRLALEPKRLWQRTLLSGPLFFSHVLKNILPR